jgi:hypothetical protein
MLDCVGLYLFDHKIVVDTFCIPVDQNFAFRGFNDMCERI